MHFGDIFNNYLQHLVLLFKINMIKIYKSLCITMALQNSVDYIKTLSI